MMAHNQRLLQGILSTVLLAPIVLPAAVLAKTPNPIRWNTGGAVWSTSQEAFDTFIDSGSITDRGLEGGLHRSGWTSEQIRAGLNKNYNVDFIALSNFLYAPAGENYLKLQTRSYVPYYTLSNWATQALRSAIILDAADGIISGAGIIRQLPVDFRSAKSSPFDGKQNVAATSNCKDEAQCTSLFSWMVFLPADLSNKSTSL